jgi:outer membrane protein
MSPGRLKCILVIVRIGCLYLFLVFTPLHAQPLSLQDAVQMALRQNPTIGAAGAGLRAAESRIAAARSASLPRVNWSESFTRGNNPVFVFSSLLTQHRFGADNFSLGPLNRPDALNNFQSQITLEQTIYDAGQTRHSVQAAEISQRIAGEEERRARQEVIASVVRAYYAAVLGAENLRAAVEALRSAEADLRRAETVRAAGMSTDADVLSIRVHLSGVKERQIRAAADLDVARSSLNDTLGRPLDAVHALTTPLAPADLPEWSLEELERKAGAERPEARQVKLGTNLAQTQTATARSALMPQVVVHTAFEADRQRFVTRGGTNWLAAVDMRWNLFNGLGDKARIAEAAQVERRAAAEEARVESAVRLQVRRAWADLRAAGQRIEVAKASVEMAAESLRITQNRYQAGMSNVTELLRNETAVLDTKVRYLAAIFDQRVAATMLDYAAGTLTLDSEVLN